MSSASGQSVTFPLVPTWKPALGWTLIAIAFLIAMWPAAKAGNAFATGQNAAGMTIAWLVLAFVAWVVTGKHAPDVKANGRIVVGILLVLSSIGGVGSSAEDKETGKRFMRDAIALSQQHEKRFEELGQRMKQSNLSDVLAPGNVTTRAGIAQGRARIAEYRALITERGAVLKQNIDEGKQLIRALPAGPVKSGAESSLQGKQRESARIFAEIDSAELAQLAQVEKMLDWCVALGGKLKQDKGQIIFASQTQADLYKTMMDELHKLDLEVGYASKAVERTAARLDTTRAESLKRAEKIFAE